jgi:glycosyltransferase involved in cell wall biosynthesis
MRLGCPVVVSSTTAVAELAGDAGLAVDPDDVAGWSAAMARVCDDDTLRAAMVAAGTQRAAGYTWDRSVDALMDAWRLAATVGDTR